MIDTLNEWLPFSLFRFHFKRYHPIKDDIRFRLPINQSSANRALVD